MVDGRMARVRDRWRMGRLHSGEVVVDHRSCPQGRHDEEALHSHRQVGVHEREVANAVGKDHRHGDHSSREEVGYDDGNRHGEDCSHLEEVHGGHSSNHRVAVRHTRGEAEESEIESGLHEVVEAQSEGSPIGADRLLVAKTQGRMIVESYIRDAADDRALKVAAIELLDSRG